MIDVDMFKCKNCGSRNTYSTKRFIVCRRCSFRKEIISEIKKEMIEGIEVSGEEIKEKETGEDVGEETKRKEVNE